MPPLILSIINKLTVAILFSAIFKVLRKYLEKNYRNKIRFNKLTPDDEAFNIHFLNAEEITPLFKLKIVS